jgi:hypothetical protein
MKWGVLQKPLRWDLQTNCDVIITCALLHNLCIDDWLANDREVGDYEFQRSFVGDVEQMGENLGNYDNLRNPYPNTETDSVLERACRTTPKRYRVAKFIGNSSFIRETFSKKLKLND